MKHYFEDIGVWPHSNKSVEFYYTLGFVLCIIATIVGYEMVAQHIFAGISVLIVSLSLALVQFVVQVLCFLHIDFARVSRTRLIALFSAILVVFILVGGSVWIMANLSDRMTPTPAEMEQYMQTQPGI